MRIFTATITAIITLSIAHVANAQSFGISTGGTKGTYFQFGKDLSEIAKKNGINLEVLNSRGSVENLYRILKSPDTQLAIIQHDALFWMEAQEEPTARRIAQKTKMILPLYNEEIHVLAREDSNIGEFEDLNGKSIAMGKLGSGTSVTAETLFRIANIRPGNRSDLGGAEALEALKRGDIDAMFYVAGAPVKLFADNVKSTDNLNLVSITNKDIADVYQSAILDHYNWTKDDVRTVAVKAILVTYDYLKGGRKCKFVEQVALSLWNGLDELKNSGHAKWKSVDLTASLNGIDESKCVEDVKRPSDRSSPNTTGFTDFLNKIRRSQN